MAEGAPAPVVRRRSTLEPLALHPHLELGAGGEARVYALDGDPSAVAKVYHAPAIAQARKVALMMATPPSTDASVARLAWPRDLLLDRGGRFAGFVMARAEGPRLFELYNPSSRRHAAPLFHHALLHRAGANLAAAFEALHAAGYVVGDVNESNVLVGDDGAVTLVDTDSFPVRDLEDGAVHRSHVGKPEFTPPELQGRHFADFNRAPEHDRFGLAVLLFLLLMEGTHPFAARMEGEGEAPPVEDRILGGLFPHVPRDDCRPPRMAPPFAVLDPGLRALFVRAFADGHADPAARPSPAEWRRALLAAEARTAACAANARHRFGAHLEACPWCERTALLGGRDPFPAVPETVRRAPKRISRPLPPPIPAPRAAGPAPLVPVARPVLSTFAFSDPAGRRNVSPATALMMGPAGTANPVTWVLPLLWTAVLGPVLLRPLALLALLFTLGRLWKRGLGTLVPATAGVTILFLLAAVASSASSWVAGAAPYSSHADGSFRDEYDGMAPTPGVDPRVVISAPYTRDVVDRDPELLNHSGMERRLDKLYVHDGRTAVDRGAILLGVYVFADGSVDPNRVDTSDASDLIAAAATAGIVGEMRFVPLTVEGGEPTEGWVWLPIRFDRYGVP